MYIADRFNHRIRKVTGDTGIITTYAGTGTPSDSGDGGQATSAELSNPHGVVLDASGRLFFLKLLFVLLTTLNSLDNVYITDTFNHRVRKITVSTGIITSIAGTGTYSYSGDGGAATSATLNAPTCITLDSAGKFISTFY